MKKKNSESIGNLKYKYEEGKGLKSEAISRSEMDAV